MNSVHYFPRPEFARISIPDLVAPGTDSSISGNPGNDSQLWVENTCANIDNFLASHIKVSNMSSIALGFHHYFSAALEGACHAVVENSFRAPGGDALMASASTLYAAYHDEDEVDGDTDIHAELMLLSADAPDEVLTIEEDANGIARVIFNAGLLNIDSEDESSAVTHATFHSYFLEMFAQHANKLGLGDEEMSLRLKFHTRAIADLEQHKTSDRHLLMQQIAFIAASTPVMDTASADDSRTLTSMTTEKQQVALNQMFNAIRSTLLWDYLECFFGEDSRVFCFNSFGRYINTTGAAVANHFHNSKTFSYV